VTIGRIKNGETGGGKAGEINQDKKIHGLKLVEFKGTISQKSPPESKQGFASSHFNNRSAETRGRDGNKSIQNILGAANLNQFEELRAKRTHQGEIKQGKKSVKGLQSQQWKKKR